jgi:hypothetical protein
MLAPTTLPVATFTSAGPTPGNRELLAGFTGLGFKQENRLTLDFRPKCRITSYLIRLTPTLRPVAAISR